MALFTDDMGVFNSTLSNEYATAARVFNLNGQDLAAMATEALNWAFVDDAMRESLRVRFLQDIANLPATSGVA